MVCMKRWVDIQKFPLQPEKIRTIPSEERTFYFLAGHVANEINVFFKLVGWTVQTEVSCREETFARGAQATIIAKVFAGKLNEAWELLNTSFFGSGISQKYEPKLTERSREALRNLKQYFGKKNLIKDVRNKFAFHYTCEEFQENIMEAAENSTLEMYIATSGRYNSLYAGSETVSNYAMLKYLDEDSAEAALNSLFMDLDRVGTWFADFLEGYMLVATRDYLGASGEELGVESIRISSLQEFEKVTIPYFSDVKS